MDGHVDMSPFPRYDMHLPKVFLDFAQDEKDLESLPIMDGNSDNLSVNLITFQNLGDNVVNIKSHFLHRGEDSTMTDLELEDLKGCEILSEIPEGNLAQLYDKHGDKEVETPATNAIGSLASNTKQSEMERNLNTLPDFGLDCQFQSEPLEELFPQISPDNSPVIDITNLPPSETTGRSEVVTITSSHFKTDFNEFIESFAQETPVIREIRNEVVMATRNSSYVDKMVSQKKIKRSKMRALENGYEDKDNSRKKRFKNRKTKKLFAARLKSEDTKIFNVYDMKRQSQIAKIAHVGQTENNSSDHEASTSIEILSTSDTSTSEIMHSSNIDTSKEDQKTASERDKELSTALETDHYNLVCQFCNLVCKNSRGLKIHQARCKERKREKNVKQTLGKTMAADYQEIQAQEVSLKKELQRDVEESKSADESANETFNCKMCNFESKTMKGLRIHQTRWKNRNDQHKNVNIFEQHDGEEIKSEDESANESFICRMCNFESKTMKGLRIHQARCKNIDGQYKNVKIFSRLYRASSKKEKFSSDLHHGTNFRFLKDPKMTKDTMKESFHRNQTSRQYQMHPEHQYKKISRVVMGEKQEKIETEDRIHDQNSEKGRSKFSNVAIKPCSVVLYRIEQESV